MEGAGVSGMDITGFASYGFHKLFKPKNILNFAWSLITSIPGEGGEIHIRPLQFSQSFYGP